MFFSRFCTVITGLMALLAYSGYLDLPLSTGGAMYTSGDIYNLFNAGTAGSKQIGSFTKHVARPTAGTFHTLDDANMNKWVDSPGSRFTDNGNGTVTDNRTGLIWLANANVAGARDWATALTDVAGLNRDGTMNGIPAGDTSNCGSHQTDWRLPNVKELLSLCDYERTNPDFLTGHPFSGALSHHYWSNTTDSDVPEKVWFVYMGNGAAYDGNKTGTCYVWPVRGAGVGEQGIGEKKLFAGSIVPD